MNLKLVWWLNFKMLEVVRITPRISMRLKLGTWKKWWIKDNMRLKISNLSKDWKRTDWMTTFELWKRKLLMPKIHMPLKSKVWNIILRSTSRVRRKEWKVRNICNSQATLSNSREWKRMLLRKLWKLNIWPRKCIIRKNSLLWKIKAPSVKKNPF